MKIRITNHTGSVDITENLETLYINELRSLLKVRTTVTQAKKIEKRNQKALNMLRKFERRRSRAAHSYFPFFTRIYIGCPHCNGLQCRRDKACAWDSYPVHNVHTTCAHARFGKVSLCDIDSVSLCPEMITVMDCGDYDNDRGKTFLSGHIEWARIVQKLGGVRNQKWTVKRV